MRLSWLLTSFLLLVGSYAWPKETNQDDKRLKIVVVDTPIAEAQLTKPYMCKNGSFSIDPRRKSYNPTSDEDLGIFHHGQNVVGLIGDQIDSTKYCIYHIAFFFEHDNDNMPKYTNALMKILKLKNLAGVNLSVSNDPRATPGRSAYDKFEDIILTALATTGIKVVVAAGNSHLLLTKTECNVYPACLRLKMSKKAQKNFYVVGSSTYYKNYDGSVHIFSNLSDDLGIFEEDGVDVGTPPMTGTSQATAIFTGKLFSR